MVKEIGLSGDEKILDVATGIGVMVPSYLRYLKNGSVRAIDYSENMIEVAKRRFPSDKFPNVSFEMMNLYDLDCEKNSIWWFVIHASRISSTMTVP